MYRWNLFFTGIFVFTRKKIKLGSCEIGKKLRCGFQSTGICSF